MLCSGYMSVRTSALEWGMDVTESQWQPCSECLVRLRHLGGSRQQHTAGLKEVEVKSQFDDPQYGSKYTIAKCENCALEWGRAESQVGALRQYESQFSPHPTEDQKPGIPSDFRRTH